MVSKREEEGREKKGRGCSLSLVPPSSRNPEVERCQNKPGKKGVAYFLSSDEDKNGGVKETWVQGRGEKAPTSVSQAASRLKWKWEEGIRVILTVSFTLGGRTQQAETVEQKEWYSGGSVSGEKGETFEGVSSWPRLLVCTACVKLLEIGKPLKLPTFPSSSGQAEQWKPLSVSLYILQLLLHLSTGVFLSFLLALFLVYTVLSLPLTLKGILRRAHIHRKKGRKLSLRLPGCWVLQPLEFFLSETFTPPPTSPCLLWMMILLLLCRWSHGRAAASSAPVTSHTLVAGWGSLFHFCCVHDLILLNGCILVSVVQSWKADLLAVNHGRPFPPLFFLLYWPEFSGKVFEESDFLLEYLLLPDLFSIFLQKEMSASVQH